MSKREIQPGVGTDPRQDSRQPEARQSVGSGPGGSRPTRETRHRDPGLRQLVALKVSGGSCGQQEVGAMGKLGRKKQQ